MVMNSFNESSYLYLENELYKTEFQNFFKNKNNPEFIEYLDNFSDFLFSIEPLRPEFTAFSNLRIIFEYMFDNDCIDNHKEFFMNIIDLFSSLLESKLDLIKNNDLDHQKEYEKQIKNFDLRILEYNSYFFKNIYENTNEDNQDAIELGNIILH